MAEEALKAPIAVPADGDWSAFDRQLRAAG